MIINAEVHGPVTMADYHQKQTLPVNHPGYIESQSGLKRFINDPLGYTRGEDPEPKKEKPALRYGSVFDKWTLGRETFEQEFIVQPEHYIEHGMECPSCLTVTNAATCAGCKKNGFPAIRVLKEIKKPWNNGASVCDNWTLNAASAGLIPVPSDVMARIERAHAILMEDDDAKKLIVPGGLHQCKITAVWSDPETGVEIPVRGLIDILGWNHATDLKTSRAVSTNNLGFDGWYRQCVSFGYFFQAAFYFDILRAAGENVENFHHVVQSSAWPHSVACWTVSEDQLAFGRKEYTAALKLRAQCLKTGVWPGITKGLPVIPTPGWVERQMRYEEE